MFRRTAVVLALCLGAGACAAQPGALSDVIPIMTASAPATVCDDALATGQVVADQPPYGIGLGTPDGQVMHVVWPFGYAAAVDGDQLVLLGPDGNVIAREGERISMGGGMGDDVWHACPSVTNASRSN